MCILPVGGGIYLSAASVIRDSGKDVALLGVDADVYETDPTVADLLLTSILKAIDVGVSTAIIEAGEGNFDATPYVGVLEDEGVGIAPFHDFEDKVSPDLQAELDEIIAGHHRRVHPRHVLPRGVSSQAMWGGSVRRPPHCCRRGHARRAHPLGASTHPRH